MKTLYALIFACLVMQACNQTETPTGSINVAKHGTTDRVAKSYDQDYAMWTTLPTAEYWIGSTIADDDYTAAVSYDQDYAMWTTLPTAEYWIGSTIADDDYTAADNTGSVNLVVPNYSLDTDSELYWPLP
jgi:hypothetical protein